MEENADDAFEHRQLRVCERSCVGYEAAAAQKVKGLMSAVAAVKSLSKSSVEVKVKWPRYYSNATAAPAPVPMFTYSSF